MTRPRRWNFVLELRPEIPMPISDFILKTLQKDPTLRYPSAEVMLEALAAARHYHH